MNESSINTLLLGIAAVASAMSPIILGILAYMQKLRGDAVAKTAEAVAVTAEAAATNVAEVKATLQKQGLAVENKIDAIHVVVNSERTAMIERLNKYHQEVVTLIESNSKLKEAAAARSV